MAMVISDKPVPGTVLRFRNKYFVKNSLLRHGSSNCQTQFCSNEGETLWKLETGTSEIMFKGNESIDEINENFVSLQYGELTDMLEKDISDEILRLLYIMSLYTINNCKTTAGSKNCSFPELYQSLNHLIPLSNKNKIQCFKMAASLKPPDFVLDVKIVEAIRLKWKKYLEFSRLFCKMWISSNPELVKFTKPVDFPIHPEWNESYRLDVKNPETDALIIEIRKVIVKDRNPGSQKQAVSSVVEASDDTDKPKVPPDQPDSLFGWSDVRLSDVFCEGVDTWVPVKSIKNGRAKGYLHVVMKIGISKQNGGICALKRHLLLIRLCIEDALKDIDRGKIISSWEQLVSPTASTLIYLHSLIESVPICEDTISWFIVINHIAMKNRIISVQFVHNLLLGCEKNIRQLSCVKGCLDGSLENAFKIEVEVLNKRCLNLIENLHSLDLHENKSHLDDFEFSLRIVRVSNEFLKLRNDAGCVMKSEAPKWLRRIAGSVPVEISDKIKYLTEFTKCTKEFLESADRIVGKVYPEISYTGIIYEDLDNFFQNELKDNVSGIAWELTLMIGEKDKLLMDVLKLFEYSKYLLFYINKVTKNQMFEEKFESLCVWFGVEVIEDWFNWKTRIVICQIKMALCFDDLMGTSTYRFGLTKEKISSTTKVVSDILRTNLIELWKIVSNTTTSNFNRYLIKSLHHCCTIFVSGFLKNSPRIILSADKRKLTRKKLYVVANDLHFLSLFIGQMISNTVKILPAGMIDTKAFLSDASQKVCAILCDSLIFVANKRIIRIIEAGSKIKQKIALLNYATLMERKIGKEANRYLISDMFSILLLNFGRRILDIIQNYVEFYARDHSDKLLNKFYFKRNKSRLIFEGLLEVSKKTEKLCLDVGEMHLSQQVWHDEFKELEQKIVNILIGN